MQHKQALDAQLARQQEAVAQTDAAVRKATSDLELANKSNKDSKKEQEKCRNLVNEVSVALIKKVN